MFFLLSSAAYVIFHIYTCKGVLELCDTLNVFDSAIEGEFLQAVAISWQHLYSDQIFHMSTCMSGDREITSHRA